jgi:hypothetical protein
MNFLSGQSRIAASMDDGSGQLLDAKVDTVRGRRFWDRGVLLRQVFVCKLQYSI